MASLTFTSSPFKAATTPKAYLIAPPSRLTDPDADRQDGYKVIKVETATSRYLGAIRGDIIEKGCKSIAKEGKDTQIHIALQNEKQIVPAAIAVARAFPKFSLKSKDQSNAKIQVTFDVATGSIDEKTLQSLPILTESVRDAARLVDMPPNYLDTATYVAEVTAFVEENSKSVKLEVITGEDLKKKGYGLIYSVGKIAPQPPSLAILTYTPKNASSSYSLGLCGKGIIYDSGGMSLKSTPNMCGMKADMGGSAAVYGAFQTFVKSGVDFQVSAVLCLSENPIGSGASRNDDVVIGYSGKSVEINNTDAEGRLVLADGIAHLSKHCQPTHIINIATLTGAQGMISGLRHAACMSNTQEFEDLMIKAGQSSGDWCFPMLYAPELLMKEFDSEIADMKNSVKDRTNAQSSAAGHFIESHMWKEWKGQFAHVDIAFPAISGERGTGFGVALLVEAGMRLQEAVAKNLVK